MWDRWYARQLLFGIFLNTTYVFLCIHSQPKELYKVNVNVWSNNQCAAAYDHRIPGEIKDSMICAAAPGKDSCSVRNKTRNYYATTILLNEFFLSLSLYRVILVVLYF